MRKFIILFSLLVVSLSKFGVDLSTLTSKEAFSCLLSYNYTFLNVRAWHSYGGFDVNAPQTLVNALAAGFTQQNLGVYMFPCFSAEKKPADQVSQMIEALGNSKYSQLWIDMQTNLSPGCGWGKDYEANCQFTVDLYLAAKKSGKIVGIYASNYMWNLIMGGADKCTKFVTSPLWYAHYDNTASFSDFKSFGGWQKPYAKQYKGTTALCEASVDLNYKE